MMVLTESNMFYGEDLCDFIWQFEQRNRWHNFTDREIQIINEAVKQNQKIVTFKREKMSNEFTLDLNEMYLKCVVSKYERRVRCLVSNSGLHTWLWKNEHEEWNSFNPELAFFLEVAYQKKENKLHISGYRYNLDILQRVNKKTKRSEPFKREIMEVVTTKAIEDIIEKNVSIFQKACALELSSLKRPLTSVTDSSVSAKRLRKDQPPTIFTKDDSILPSPGILQIKNKINAVIESEALTETESLKNVSVDEECPAKAEYHIYTEGSIVFSAMLNLTSLQNNNNKFYMIELLEHNKKKQYCVWRRWGRVGNKGQTNLNNYSTSLSEAKAEFEGKFYDKTRNYWSEAQQFVRVPGKYDFIHRDLNSHKKEIMKKLEAKSKLPTKIKALMELICDTQRMEEIMKEMSYDSDRTPLGKLTLLQVNNGYSALLRIADIIENGGSHRDLLNACNEFYTKIPHSFGMKTPPIIRSKEDISQKLKMLEALSNITVAMGVMNADSKTIEHPLDKYYNSLSCLIDVIEPDSLEYSTIEKCLNETHGPTHNTYKMEIVHIFKIQKFTEEETSINQKLLLWHGSRIVNWLGILKNGLLIAPPEAPRTGYMFGKGIYFADVSSKSANYCYATKKKNEGLLLMCEVLVGKQHAALEADEKMPETLPPDCDSLVGKGKITPSNFETSFLSSEAKIPVGPLVENAEHKGSLCYNEYVVYNTNQVKLRYLIQIKFNFK